MNVLSAHSHLSCEDYATDEERKKNVRMKRERLNFMVSVEKSISSWWQTNTDSKPHAIKFKPMCVNERCKASSLLTNTDAVSLFDRKFYSEWPLPLELFQHELLMDLPFPPSSLFMNADLYGWERWKNRYATMAIERDELNSWTTTAISTILMVV